MAYINLDDVDKETVYQKHRKRMLNAERKLINVRLTPKMHKRLRIIASQKETTMQDIIFTIISDYLNNQSK